MLPNRLNLFKTTEDELKKIRQSTGLTPNVAARIAFAFSLKDSFTHHDSAPEERTNGTLNLDKITWFGEHLALYELLLRRAYPNLEGKDLEKAWASHVQAGLPALRGRRNITDLI